MGTHPIFESDFDCLTDFRRTQNNIKWPNVPERWELLVNMEPGMVLRCERSSKNGNFTTQAIPVTILRFNKSQTRGRRHLEVFQDKPKASRRCLGATYAIIQSDRDGH